MFTCTESRFRLELKDDRGWVVRSKFYPRGTNPKMRRHGNRLGTVAPPLVPILRGLVAEHKMILRELAHDAVSFGLVTRIEAEIRPAFRFRVQFFECRHARLKKQVACEFIFFGGAISLCLVPSINFLHGQNLKRKRPGAPNRTSFLPSVNTSNRLVFLTIP